jgi:hypothetical protein
MALSNKSPLGSISDIVADLRAKRGLDYGCGVRDNLGEITPTKRDFWQEGLQQEYAAQVQFESLIGE